jgi:hypothetical protein
MVSDEEHAAVCAQLTAALERSAALETQLAATLERMAELEPQLAKRPPPAFVKANVPAAPVERPPRRKRAPEHNQARYGGRRKLDPR